MSNTVTRNPDAGTDEVAAEIAAAGAHLADLGFAPGRSGNVSVRVGDRILITPTGSQLGALDPSRLSVIDLAGEHVAGPSPSKEAPLHAAAYRARPDIGSVIHLHSTNATAVACQLPEDPARALPPITPYFVMRVGRVPLLDFAPPGSARLVELVATLGDDTMAALMANHGSLCFGEDLTEAIDVAIELEAAARVYLLSMAGNQVSLDAQQIAAITECHPVRWRAATTRSSVSVSGGSSTSSGSRRDRDDSEAVSGDGATGPDRSSLGDPALDAWLRDARKARDASYRELGIEAVRAAKDRRDRAKPRGVDVAESRDAATDDGLAMRVHRGSAGPAPAIVYLHGGGFATGGLESHDAVCRQLAASTGAVVFAVDYRLAPEHPAPAAIDDSVTAAEWVMANGHRFGVDPARGVALAGDSSGGALAILAGIRLVRAGHSVAGLLLVYPNTDMTLSFESVVSEGHGWGLESEDLRWYLELWVPEPGRRADPEVSPLFADLRGLPDTLVVTVEHDPLRDEGIALVERLRSSGVAVVHDHLQGLVHGFLGMTHFSPKAASATVATFERFGGMLEAAR